MSQVVSGIDVIVSTLQASDFADFAKGITTNDASTFGRIQVGTFARIKAIKRELLSLRPI